MTQQAMATLVCSDLFSSEGESLRSTTTQELESRMVDHFRAEWFKDRPLSDADAAKKLLKKIERHGTDMDRDILDVYLQILQSTQGNYFVREPGFYVDMHMGERPKSSHFQERHWDWNILEGYFFNSPSLLTFTKEQDLSYLNHVLKTAQSGARPKSLKRVLQEANRSWALSALQPHSKILQEYVAYDQGKKYSTLYADLITKFFASKYDPTNSLEAFRSSNSSFDLFILNKYLDLTLKFPSGSWKPPSWLQLTDWRVFEMGLPTGSVDYITDFLFQNSHDMTAKIYLVRILNEMESLKSKSSDDFYFSFLQARRNLDSRIKPIAAPPMYQTDLRIFSVSHEPQERSGPSSLNEVHVFWNETLGRLQANVVRSFPTSLNRDATVGMNPQLRSYIKKYFDNYRQEKTYLPEEIDHFENKEFNSPLLETTYIAFTKRGSDEMLAMIRIFDATHSKTFIESDYNLNFEERKNGESIFELGRLIASAEVEAKSFPFIMARVAEYFKNIGTSGVTYGDGNRAATAYYQRFGYKLVLAPEQLNIKGEATPMWVFKQSVADLIERFSKPFETVRLRKLENTQNPN